MGLIVDVVVRAVVSFVLEDDRGSGSGSGRRGAQPFPDALFAVDAVNKVLGGLEQFEGWE